MRTIRGKSPARSPDQPLTRLSACSPRGDLLDGFFELAEVDGLGEVDGETGRAAQLDVVGGTESGKCDRRDRAVRADGVHQLEAAAVGELDVADEHVEIGFGREPEAPWPYRAAVST